MYKKIFSYILVITSIFLMLPSSISAAGARAVKVDQAAIDKVSGPGYAYMLEQKAAEEAKLAAEAKAKEKGRHIGIFKTTGYNDSTPAKPRKTASGVLPQANHTIAADWNVLPKGTKVRIGDSPIIYTVEDKGGSVKGNVIDIFYASSSEAWGHGVQYFDVYIVEDTSTDVAATAAADSGAVNVSMPTIDATDNTVTLLGPS